MGTRVVQVPPVVQGSHQAQFSDAVAGESRWVELGFGLVVIATPLAFAPMSRFAFADVKLVLVLMGAVAICIGLRARLRMTMPALAWVAVMWLAAVFGVDPGRSVIGPENQASGVLLLGASAFLLVAATRVPESVRSRIPRWLVGGSTAVAVISLTYRASPKAWSAVTSGLSFEGGTLGHPVFLAGMCGAGLVASVALTRTRAAILIPLLIVQATALSFSTKRVGLIAVAVGLAVALWRMGLPRRRAALIVGVVAATLVSWALLQAFVFRGESLSGASRFADLRTDSALSRTETLPAFLRAWSKRPLLGWGPGNTWSAYIASGTEEEFRVAGGGWGDAHNLLVEAAVTTGVVGLAALLVLLAVAVRHVRRGPPQLGWAAGCAAALGIVHLLQPINVALTPLFFLMAGLGDRAGRDPEAERSGLLPRRLGFRWAARLTVGVLLAGGVVLSSVLLAASVLELHGRTYASEWSLRAAHALAPGRLSPTDALGTHLTVEARSGDTAAHREATTLVSETVRRHPWNPDVRLVAANVHALLGDPMGARWWIERHLARFPQDLVRVHPSGASSLRPQTTEAVPPQ
jgi:O-antigen ligase